MTTKEKKRAIMVIIKKAIADLYKLQKNGEFSLLINDAIYHLEKELKTIIEYGIF